MSNNFLLTGDTAPGIPENVYQSPDKVTYQEITICAPTHLQAQDAATKLQLGILRRGMYPNHRYSLQVKEQYMGLMNTILTEQFNVIDYLKI